MAEVSLQQPLSIEERIPESAKFEKLSSASIIRGRRTVRFQPSTGTTVDSFNGSQIITFRISDSNAYLDPLSAYLAFDLALTQGTIATHGGIAWDDTVISLFNRVRTEFNSVNMDDINDVDSLVAALIYSLGDKNAYCQDLGLQAGSWKWNSDNYGVAPQTNGTLVAAPTTVVFASEGQTTAVQRRASTWYSSNYTAADEATPESVSKFKFAVPLSYFRIGVMAQPKFLALRNLGILSIHLYTNTAGRALRTGVAEFASTAATTAGKSLFNHTADLAGGKFVMSNLAIVAQVLDMDPRYLEITDRQATSSETGIVYDFNTFTNLKASYTASTSVTERNITVSKATTSLRNMYIVRQPSSWRESAGYCGVTGFPYMDCQGFRVQINSLYIPEYGPAESATEQYNMGRQAHALLGNQDSVGNTRVDGFVSVASEDSDINGQHVLVAGFDRSTNQNITLDGINTVSSGGSITLTIRDAGSLDAGGANPITMNTWAEFTRFLVLKQNSVSVVG